MTDYPGPLLQLRGMGSYRAGGRVATVSGAPVREIQVTRSAGLIHDPNGVYPVDHAWVEYYLPEPRRPGPPVVLLHGGGLHGGMWSTTPDGRPGWLQTLLALGYEVHVVDNPERGRAGWMPGHFPGEPVLRNLQQAWEMFRMGRLEDFDARVAYPDCRFPIDALEDFGRFACPRWTSSRQAQTDAFEAVLEHLDQAIVICHSQGGEIAFEAAARQPGRVSRIVAVEPSGYAEDMDRIVGIPLTLVAGDYLDRDARWQVMARQWQALVDAMRKAGGHADLLDCAQQWPGTTHMLMMDRGNDEIIRAIVSAWGR